MEKLSRVHTEKARLCVQRFCDKLVLEHDFETDGELLEVREHSIILALKSCEIYPWATEILLALYQQHFLTLNSLYQLRPYYLDQYQLRMDFSPMGVSFSKISDTETGAQLEQHKSAALEDFYGDYINFNSATTSTVADLLATFWKKFQALDERGDALAVLGLDTGADWQSICKRYRQLVQQCHPDRGGDSIQFLSIQAAYEQLKMLR